MNKAQRAVLWVGMAGFLASVVFAPWESALHNVVDSDPHPRFIYGYAPIWETQDTGAPGLRMSSNLRYGMLATWWAALGIACTGGLVIAASKKPST